jgi:hypothetical protein
MATETRPRRTRVERGIYRQPNGKYAICARRDGVLRFRTAGYDLGKARLQRIELVTSLKEGRVPASPRLRFDTVAGRWLARFEAKVAAGERHPRTLEAHRYHLDHNLLPGLRDPNGAASGCWGELRSSGCSPPAHRAGACSSPPPSTAGCGSPSSSG